jgi:putative transposase
MGPLVRGHAHAGTTLVVHMVWGTRGRVPWIESRFDAWLAKHLERKARELDGELLAVGNSDDHVHVLVRHSPRIAVAQIAHRLKGASSHDIHLLYPETRGRDWQSGYWAESVGPTNLDPLIDYILNQRAHHQVPHLRERWQSARP